MMKMYIQNLVVLSIAIALGGCNSADSETKSESETKSAMHAAKPKKAVTQTSIASGKIQSISKEKDGYAAELLTDEDDTYYITISHSNLITPSQYREFKIGESVTVVGEYWQMDHENHLSVHSIQ
jgi:starvation-inducible outer membrane lipoprotein